MSEREKRRERTRQTVLGGGGKTETVVYGYRNKKREKERKRVCVRGIEREGKKRRGRKETSRRKKNDADETGFRGWKESHRIGLIKWRWSIVAKDRAANSRTDFRGSRNEHGWAVESRVHAQLNRWVVVSHLTIRQWCSERGKSVQGVGEWRKRKNEKKRE